MKVAPLQPMKPTDALNHVLNEWLSDGSENWPSPRLMRKLLEPIPMRDFDRVWALTIYSTTCELPYPELTS